MMEGINKIHTLEDSVRDARDVLNTLIQVIGASMMILGVIGLVYHMNVHCTSQRIPTAAPACPVRDDDSAMIGRSEGARPVATRRAHSRLEVDTCDPFIEHMLNGTKTMVFMSGDPRSYYPICNMMEGLIGEIITLNSRSNCSGGMPVVRVIDGVWVKGVRRVNLMHAIVGDYSANCGECNYAAGISGCSYYSYDGFCSRYYPFAFCEIRKAHEVYTWFAPGLEGGYIINRVFSSVWGSDCWAINWQNPSHRKCSGYSMSDVNGFYFSRQTHSAMFAKSTHQAKSVITHAIMDVYDFKDPKDTGQCFIEIELVDT